MAIIGGKMRDYPHPHKRKWPESSERRRVRIEFTDWSVSIGGRHISLKIKEEHNYLWDGEHWRECWDDLDGQGFELETKFERYEDAVKVAKAIVRIMFPDKARYDIDWSGKRTRYVYARQSD